jgi:hypothetical protein
MPTGNKRISLSSAAQTEPVQIVTESGQLPCAERTNNELENATKSHGCSELRSVTFCGSFSVTCTVLFTRNALRDWLYRYGRSKKKSAEIWHSRLMLSASCRPGVVPWMSRYAACIYTTHNQWRNRQHGVQKLSSLQEINIKHTVQVADYSCRYLKYPLCYSTADRLMYMLRYKA